VGADTYGPSGPKAPNPETTGARLIPFSGPNYVVYDECNDDPPGFTLRIERTSGVFLTVNPKDVPDQIEASDLTFGR